MVHLHIEFEKKEAWNAIKCRQCIREWGPMQPQQEAPVISVNNNMINTFFLVWTQGQQF